MSGKETCEVELSAARLIRLRALGSNIDALSSELKAQLATLDDDEIAALSYIKQKLDDGLDETLLRAAGCTGGFVW